jgi:hypothetical protein
MNNLTTVSAILKLSNAIKEINSFVSSIKKLPMKKEIIFIQLVMKVKMY